MGRFTGKVVLVTGALGGIGSATARRFAAEGALLALTDIGKTADDVPAALVAGAADWDSWPTGWAFWPADLSKPDDRARLVADGKPWVTGIKPKTTNRSVYAGGY